MEFSTKLIFLFEIGDKVRDLTFRRRTSMKLCVEKTGWVGKSIIFLSVMRFRRKNTSVKLG